MKLLEKLIFPIFVFSLLAIAPDVAEAKPICPGHPSCKDNDGDSGDGGAGSGDDLEFLDSYTPPDSYYDWMHEDVGLAHSLGFTGVGSSIIVVDFFADSDTHYSGNLIGEPQPLTHGEWTSLESSLVAPGAAIVDMQLDLSEGVGRVELSFGDGLNVINQSYGLFGTAGAKLVYFGPQNNSIVTAASDGTAVVVKAAGNYSAPVDEVLCCIDGALVQDLMNIALIGKQGALFVGALDGNGTPTDQASLAYYSSYAGSSKRIQNQFLVVGVDAAAMGGLAGTSFAAPIVSGYAAILGGKFTGAAPAAVVDRLLETARTDTILDYSASVHGQGEADLSRALAPNSIN